MKTTFVSHPFPGGHLQIPLLPSSSNSAFRKELGVVAVSVGFEQDCDTLLMPRPPCACPNLGHKLATFAFPGSSQEDLRSSAGAAQSHRAGLCPFSEDPNLPWCSPQATTPL